MQRSPTAFPFTFALEPIEDWMFFVRGWDAVARSPIPLTLQRRFLRGLHVQDFQPSVRKIAPFLGVLPLLPNTLT